MSSISYNFTFNEVKAVTSFFRKHEKNIPDELEKFLSSMQSHIYDNMTIEEAEVFLNENKNY